jgi:hypothetical protein
MRQLAIELEALATMREVAAKRDAAKPDQESPENTGSS